MSPANIKVIVIRGSRMASPEHLLQILEYGPGINRFEAIDTDNRSNRKCVQLIVCRYKENDLRLCRDLIISNPLDWPNYGVYFIIKIMGDKTIIKSKVHSNKRLTFITPRGGDMYVDSNFNRAFAILSVNNCSRRVTLAFINHGS